MAGLATRRYQLASVVVVLLMNCLTDDYKSEALVLEEEFAGKIMTDLKVNLPAEEVWAVYRSRGFEKLLLKLLPDYFKAVDYVTGKGGVGTILNITLQPAFGSANWLSKIVEINDKTKTRLLRPIKGGVLDSGFIIFQSGYTVIKNKIRSCTIRATVLFEIQQNSLSNATRLQPSWETALTVANYINSKKFKPLVLSEEYSAEVGTEMKVNLPADDIWDVFSSKDFGHLILELTPSYFKQIDYIIGDGGVGTVLNVTLQPASGGTNWQEKIVEIDDKTMTRRLRQVQGYRLDSGFTLFETVYQPIPKANSSCVISAVRPFKIKPESVANASTVVPSWTTAITVANYVNSMKLEGLQDI